MGHTVTGGMSRRTPTAAIFARAWPMTVKTAPTTAMARGSHRRVAVRRMRTGREGGSGELRLLRRLEAANLLPGTGHPRPRPPPRGLALDAIRPRRRVGKLRGPRRFG